MNIALLGGVFNPTHIGHVLIAQQVLDYTNVDEVWFLPSYGQHPPKPEVASVADRLAMINMVKLQRTRVSTIEIDHTLDGNTIHLLPYLPKEHTYIFVMGSDWLPSFHLWGQWQKLLQQLPFLVFPRNGFPCVPLYKNMTVIHHDLLIVTDISSTKIRGRIKRGLSIDAFVPNDIRIYIQKNRLYKGV